MSADQIKELSEATEATRRGVEARQLLESSLLSESFAAIRRGYTGQICKCDARDDLGRFRFTEALKMVDAHEGFLRGVIETGVLAQSELDALLKAQGVRRFVPKF